MVGGKGESKNLLSTIEQFTYTTGKWKVLPYDGTAIAVQAVECFHVNENTMLIFGGWGISPTGSMDLLSDCFELNMKTMSLKKLPSSLKNAEDFYGCARPILYKTKLYTLGWFTQNLHIYDTDTGVWNVKLKKLNWNLQEASSK